MKTYRLEGLKKNGNWVKYCDLDDPSDLDTFIKELLSHNSILGYTHFKVVKTETMTITSVLSICKL